MPHSILDCRRRCCTTGRAIKLRRRLPTAGSWSKLMDQHAFLQISEGDDIKVGDMIGFDISHPCLTFDRWRYLPVLDAGYNVIDVVETFF
jgi:D-serine dehydratase